MDKSLKVCFIGGKQAGVVGALTVLSRGNKISAAVSYSEDLTKVLASLRTRIYATIFDKGFIKTLRNADILICVHGREFVPQEMLKLPKIGAINVHPYLYQYKGPRPVERALRDKNFKASVGIHRMSKAVDRGELLVEEFVDVSGAKSVDEIYNRLYPYYAFSLIKALETMVKK